jgi:hypothetical protein
MLRTERSIDRSSIVADNTFHQWLDGRSANAPCSGGLWVWSAGSGQFQRSWIGGPFWREKRTGLIVVSARPSGERSPDANRFCPVIAREDRHPDADIVCCLLAAC